MNKNISNINQIKIVKVLLFILIINKVLCNTYYYMMQNTKRYKVDTPSC